MTNGIRLFKWKPHYGEDTYQVMARDSLESKRRILYYVDITYGIALYFQDLQWDYEEDCGIIYDF